MCPFRIFLLLSGLLFAIYHSTTQWRVGKKVEDEDDIHLQNVEVPASPSASEKHKISS